MDFIMHKFSEVDFEMDEKICGVEIMIVCINLSKCVSPGNLLKLPPRKFKKTKQLKMCYFIIYHMCVCVCQRCK